MPAPPQQPAPRSPAPPSPAAPQPSAMASAPRPCANRFKRGAADCLDRSARPHHLPWKASEEERAVVCALRRATNFALDDLTFVVRHFLPHLNRDSIWRILKAEGLNRRARPVSERPAKGQGTFVTTTSASCISTSSTCPSCKPATVSGANAICSSPSIAARAPSISRSRMTKPRRAPSPSCARPPPSFSDHPRADRQWQLLHASFRQGMRHPRRAISAYQAPDAPNQWHGRALRRPRRQRSA